MDSDPELILSGRRTPPRLGARRGVEMVTAIFAIVIVGVLVFAITGMVLTEVINRYETRFNRWRPKVGHE